MYSLDIQASKPYQVLIDTFLLERAGEIARSLNAGRRALIISDTNVAPLYTEPVKSGLQAVGYTCELAVFSAGEEHKRAETYVGLLEKAASFELTRSDLIVALAAAWWETSRALSRRPTCAASTSSRFQPRCWPWSTPPLAERPLSTLRRERTSPVHSGSRARSSPTWVAWAR